MVLRKDPPPGILVPSRSRNGSDPRSARKDSWELKTESIYSPDLHTSPAFDLMPLEEAQKSPVASHSPWEGPWEDELVERPTEMGYEAASASAEAADQIFGNTNESNQHQQTAENLTNEPSSQRFRSNNPFLRTRNPSPNPWEDASQRPTVQSLGTSVSSLHPDGRDSQTSGIIPMTARLSIFDQSEDPWNQSKPQLAPESALQASSDKGKKPSLEDNGIENQYVITEAGQELDSENQWQELTLRSASDSINGVDASASQHMQRPASPQLIDLEDAPANTEDNPWFSEKQPVTVQKNEDQPSTSEQPVFASVSLPPMTEAELKSFQEKQTETYAIRHVNWTDYTGQLRESPVLVQSKNGPCPLLALVNGLTMRSSRTAQPPIVRALQKREHISLGLLIQALFDELVTYSNEELPDIEALSRFLTMLHTGMNVNPRLTLESPTAVGTFFDTKDLRLYDSFKVPLVHGWVAAPTSDAHSSMVRVAQYYYEDIQLLLIREEDLEDHVFHNGVVVTAEEERLLHDVQTIGHFVNVENTTQLTKFGLDHLSKTLSPGSVSILFRNDHFSTLYKHPQSEQLFTLVTDAGYADHPEVVWESLVDITGSDAEFFAGDFRPVGHGPSTSIPAGSSHLVSQRTSSQNHATTTSTSAPKHTTEQEDADYAYALSLQFQEEAREQQQRQRHQHSRSSSNLAPNTTSRNTIPVHRHSQSTASNSASRLTVRNPSVPSSNEPPHRSNENNLNNIPQDLPTDNNNNNDDDLPDDAPPPTYEQVARNKAAELLNRRQQQNQQHQQQYSPSPVSADYGRRSQYPGTSPAATGRRQPLQTIPDRDGRGGPRNDKDCIVM